MSWPEERDVAWSAGLYEGEGCISLVNKRRWAYVAIQMTDLEPLEKMQAVWGGTIRGPYVYKTPGRTHHKPYWRWSLPGRDAIATFFEHVWEYLSPRRRAQAERVLTAAVPEFQRPTSPDCGVERRGSSGPEWHRRRGEPACQRCRDNESAYRYARGR